jgi:hypothetical protein
LVTTCPAFSHIQQLKERQQKNFACVMPGCRYLVETPANVCTPEYLADTAARIAALAPERFQLDVLNRPAVEALGMGLYLGVAQVSPGLQGVALICPCPLCHCAYAHNQACIQLNPWRQTLGSLVDNSILPTVAVTCP